MSFSGADGDFQGWPSPCHSSAHGSPWSSFLAPRSSTRTCSSYGSQQSPCFAETGLILVPLTSMHRFLTNQEEAEVQLVPRSILAILRSAGMCCWWLLIHYPFTGKIPWAYSHPLHSPPLKKFCPIPHFEELSCFIYSSEWDPSLLCNLSLKILFQTSRLHWVCPSQIWWTRAAQSLHNL